MLESHGFRQPNLQSNQMTSKPLFKCSFPLVQNYFDIFGQRLNIKNPQSMIKEPSNRSTNTKITSSQYSFHHHLTRHARSFSYAIWYSARRAAAQSCGNCTAALGRNTAKVYQRKSKAPKGKIALGRRVLMFPSFVHQYVSF